MEDQCPGSAERPEPLRPGGEILVLAILHVTLVGEGLKVGPENDALSLLLFCMMLYPTTMLKVGPENGALSFRWFGGRPRRSGGALFGVTTTRKTRVSNAGICAGQCSKSAATRFAWCPLAWPMHSPARRTGSIALPTPRSSTVRLSRPDHPQSPQLLKMHSAASLSRRQCGLFFGRSLSDLR